MDREIKFRAWDKTRNAMFPVAVVTPFVDESVDQIVTIVDFANKQMPILQPGEYELMQCTGLKDKNGVEIYEGDVIRIDGADEDEYRNGSPYVMFEKGCFAYRYSHWTDDLCIVLYQTANQMLVVGNIYENPELLEKEK